MLAFLPAALVLLAPGAPDVRPIQKIATAEPAVAITFDACATRTQGYGFDRAIFDLIRQEKVPVTIFVSGRWVEMHPDAMDELAREPLVEFGDHSYDHPHMSTLPDDRIGEQIDQTERALARYGKKSVAFRPPFGEWSPRVVHVVQGRQLPTVTWDVVSGDPSARATTEGIIRAVIGKARPGSIIIFHINGRGWKTAEALPPILHELRARGFRFVPLSELLARPQAAPVLAVSPSPPPVVAVSPSPPRSAAPQPLPPAVAPPRPGAVSPPPATVSRP
jgi:peptidoglycan/xylan/chitin deacetylase (PgdA/CDA1 family)